MFAFNKKVDTVELYHIILWQWWTYKTPQICNWTFPLSLYIKHTIKASCFHLHANLKTKEVCFATLFITFNFWHRSFTFNSNKSRTWCNNFSVYYPDFCLQLNMFRAFFRPSSGAQWLQWQPLFFPSYRGDSRAVFVVGPAGPTTNAARLSPRYEGKTRGCHCSHWAPYDGRENARNMLSCKQTSG